MANTGAFGIELVDKLMTEINTMEVANTVLGS